MLRRTLATGAIAIATFAPLGAQVAHATCGDEVITYTVPVGDGSVTVSIAASVGPDGRLNADAGVGATQAVDSPVVKGTVVDHGAGAYFCS